MTKKKIVVSGIRSTGPLHVGHYFGALKSWIELQEKYECYFFVADWHALTTDFKDPSQIKTYLLDNVSDWLALGVDPKKAALFIQSSVPEHAELYLALSMITPLGWLERNPTYKDQKEALKHKDLSNLGFLGYPVLQAADIALYQGELVPVGEDQVPHLELSREIIRRFNHLYGETLVEPQPILSASPRVLGSDGRKMSNSYQNAVLLSDPEEVVTKKVMTYMTDPARKRRQDPGDPKKCPLYSLHELFTEETTLKEVDLGCRTAKIGCVDCKKTLLQRLTPWHQSYTEKRKALNPKTVQKVLDEGQKKASAVAQKTMTEVKKALKIL